MWNSIGQDIRYGLRMLSRSPVTTAVAVISLALGIGANSVIFSLMNALILRPLPVRDPGGLVRVAATTSGDVLGIGPISLATYKQLRTGQSVFSDLFAYSGGGMVNFEAAGVKYAASLNIVSGEYFSTLGVQPILGRAITAGDLNTAVAVISYYCWHSRYQGDRGVIGKTISVEGVPLTIIGVTPENFPGLIIDVASDATVPIGYTNRDARNDPFDVCARLRPGVSIAHAQAQIASIWPRIREAAAPADLSREQRAAFLKKNVAVVGFATGLSYMRSRFERPLTMLMAMVGLLLLIACANLANLMVARAAGRRGEFGIRVALGADRWRILRLILTESLILTLAGAALGLVAAYAISRPLLNSLWTGFVPLAVDGAPDFRVLAFTVGVSLLTGLLFGASPAWGVFRSDPAEAMQQQSGRRVRGGAGLMGRLLIAGQVALSLVLVIGAIVFVRSLANLRSIDVGFKRDGVLLATLFPASGSQERKMTDRAAFFEELARQLEAIPGVEAVSYSHMGPVAGYEFKSPVSISLSSANGGRAASSEAVFDLVGPRFFHLAGMRVLEGREFDWRDNESGSPVAIISESLARRMFPGGHGIGRRIDYFDHKNLEIVGVVNSASLWMPRSREPMAVYMPYLQRPEFLNEPNVVIRTSGNPAAALPAVREVIARLGRHVILSAETLDHRAGRFLLTERMVAMLGSFFGVLALLLGSIGIYGLMSHAVERRTSEIGLRMALGARTNEVIVLILKEVFWMVSAGLAVGLPAALAGSHLLTGFVYGVAGTDPGVVVASCVVLFGVATLAGYLPALRAARIDPMTALRSE